MAAILGGVNWMANRYPKRLDVSKDQRFSLSEQTRKILAGLQGLVGLLQVAGGEDSFLHLGDARTYGTATGTFVNRNHLAAMLAMMLPVVVGLLLYRARHGRHGGLRLDASAPVSSQAASRAGTLR